MKQLNREAEPFDVDVRRRVARERVHIVQEHVVRVPDDHSQLVSATITTADVTFHSFLHFVVLISAI